MEGTVSPQCFILACLGVPLLRRKTKMSIVRTAAATGLLICALLMPSPAVAEAAECFGPDQNKATLCQSRVAGLYHALITTQARYGLTTPACQFDPGLVYDALFERLAPDLREYIRVAPEKHFNVLVGATLLQSEGCTVGVATEPHGYKAAALLRQCEAGLKDDEAMRLCTAYLRGLYEGLRQFSGFDDAREFTCPPKTGQRAKDILQMFIDEAIRDPKVQQLAAAEVMAKAMARAFSCGSRR